jgi:hypothetical protein
LAVPPATNEAFLREVDEELRRDQLASFWTRYGRWLIVAVLLALALFAGYLFWRNHRQTVAGEEGEKLQTAYEALANNRPNDAAKPLTELAKSSIDGHRALAKFTQGDILLQRDDFKGAAAKFGEVARDESLVPAFRDLALVRQTTAEYDQIQPQVVIDRLRPIAVAGNPYFGSAGELVAAAYLRTGRRDLAGRLFGDIAKDEKAPATLRQRAVQMAGLLGVDAVVQKDVNTQ